MKRLFLIVVLALALLPAGRALAQPSCTLAEGEALQGPKTVTFHAGLSGAATLLIKLDGETVAYTDSATASYTLPLSLTEGRHIIGATERTATDSASTTRRFYVCFDPPEVQAGWRNFFYGEVSAQCWARADDASGLRYLEARIDGHKIYRYRDGSLLPRRWLNEDIRPGPRLKNGWHCIEVVAEDRAGRRTSRRFRVPLFRTVCERIGTTVRGRSILAYHIGVTSSANKTLFLGATHGNEKRTYQLLTHFLDAISVMPELLRLGHTVFIPALNPDGLAAGTRWNARRVDLNRNMSAGWGGLGVSRYGGAHYPGRYAFSEPETRALRDFYLRLAPRKIITYHSDLGIIFGNDALSRRMARFTHSPYHDVGYPTAGSLGLWMGRYFPHRTYVLVEMPGGAFERSLFLQEYSAVYAIRYAAGNP